MTTESPIFHSEAAHTALNFFESATRDIQLKAGNQCTVELIPCTDSMMLDPHQHFQAEAMLQIRISHDRGLQQPKGASEDLALELVQKLLDELGIRRAPMDPEFGQKIGLFLDGLGIENEESTRRIREQESQGPA